MILLPFDSLILSPTETQVGPRRLVVLDDRIRPPLLSVPTSHMRVILPIRPQPGLGVVHMAEVLSIARPYPAPSRLREIFQHGEIEMFHEVVHDGYLAPDPVLFFSCPRES